MTIPVLDKAIEHLKSRNTDGMNEYYCKEWDTTHLLQKGKQF